MNEPATNPAPQVKWTAHQLEAIQDRGRDLVVSASAGSGKTAVLTERVLRLVSEPDEASGEPLAHLEELLIITFTDKAARQMRERIEKRLSQELAVHPDSPFLQRAFDAVSSSWIMTIDAFCRRLVIEHFHQAGISPSPRIPDGAEQNELELTVLSDLLESWAARGNSRREALNELLRCYGRGADDLTAELRGLMHYLQSLDRPAQWLTRVRADLDATCKAARYEELPEAAAAREAFANSTQELAEALRELTELARLRGAEAGTLELWDRMAGSLEELAARPGPFRPDAIRPWLEEEADAVLGKLDLKKVCGAQLYGDEEFKKNFLARLKRHYSRWRAHWFPLDEAGLLTGARLAATQGLTLLTLAEEALTRMDEIRHRRGLMTFNDFERTALKILTDPASGEGPSEVASQLQRQFKYVLVDEYQDTSPLQDAIVRLASRALDPTPEVEGNLFLVGDYKQSIYRFRHAEPTLFLEKLGADGTPRQNGCRGIHRINLHENFRSRPRVLEFINHCFGRMMDKAVGDLAYNEGEHLVPGRVEPRDAPALCVEVQWMARVGEAQNGSPRSDGSDGSPDSGGDDSANGDDSSSEAAEVLEGLEAQAQWVARRIKELTDPLSGLLIPEDPAPADPTPEARRAMPGDCAILLRGIRGELAVWMDALEREGLKVRAPGLNPLYTTSEMLDLLSALRIADNPLQDIPLASLMRSPMLGFTDDDLLMIRMTWPHGAFHEAVWTAAGQPLPDLSVNHKFAQSHERAGHSQTAEGDEPLPAPTPNLEAMTDALRLKLATFIERIESWRTMARRLPAYELMNRILQDTGYEAFLMGHLDGLARLENIDFLRGLLRQLGRCDEGANSLASFLEMMDRAEADESDLGELPETVTLENDAVNLLTVHRSKGLEFPIVFLPRLERRFRERKISETLCDREGGMARQGVDSARRRRYPTLAHRTLIDRMRRKDRSEEIRLLYVAMTRARERLILVGQMKGLDKLAGRWAAVRALKGRPTGTLDRLHAASPADLLGPIVEWLRTEGGAEDWLHVNFDTEAATRQSSDVWTRVRQALQEAQTLPDHDPAAMLAELARATRPDVQESLESLATPTLRFLPTVDPARALTTLPAKTTVTQLKRNQPPARPVSEEEFLREEERFVEAEMKTPYFTRHGSLADRKPKWIQEDINSPKDLREGGVRLIRAARRGTLTHALLAHLDLEEKVDAASLRAQAAQLIAQGILGDPLEDSEQILNSLDFEALAWFFTTEPGRRMTGSPGRVSRELSFTAGKSLYDFAPEAYATFNTEKILVQGVIDAVIDEGATATVIDYKTDHVRGREHLEELTEHYRIQIEQYTHALEAIWKLKSVKSGLVFLDAREIVWLNERD